MAGVEAKAAELQGKDGSKRSSVAGQQQPSPAVLREHFHLPLHTVAQMFGMCTTAFKKMCRRLGIAKWPHRQLRGIDKKIAALKAELNYAPAADRQQYLSGLSQLEEEKAKLAKGLSLGSTMDGSDDDSAECDADTKPREMSAEDYGFTEPHVAGLESDDDSEVEEIRQRSTGGDGDGAENGMSTAGVVIRGKELRQHFHLPLHTAAQKFGVCTTAFKKLCRRFGIAKWPHRQLRGIDKKIAALKAELNYTTGDKESFRKQLQVLQEEKIRISQSTGKSMDDSPIMKPSSKPPAVVAIEPQHSPSESTDGSDASTSTDEKGKKAEDPMESEAVVEEEDRACASALDLLAAVAGVKEEHDRELEKLSHLSSQNTLASTGGATALEKMREAFNSTSARVKDMGSIASITTTPQGSLSPMTPPPNNLNIPPIVPPMPA
mmetsp:Transcript_47924/g.74845  ORF Transcript_47924/g.74845 Transcript_47924/m.74845 type:complete len:435 (+) Transcript_47924:121-1425(+)